MLKTAYASIKLTQEIWPDFTKRFRNPSSAESYESDLSELMNLYQIDFLEIRSEMVKDYYESIQRKVKQGNLQAGTAAKKFRELHSLADYICKNRIEYQIPETFQDFFYPYLRTLDKMEKFAKSIPIEHIDQLFVAAQNDKMAYCILALLQRVGLTSTEIVELKPENFAAYDNGVYVTVKGRKEACFIPEDVFVIVECYMSERKQHEYLFYNQRGNKLNIMYISRLMKKYTAAANIPSYSAETLRNSCAFTMFSYDATPEQVAKQMGITEIHVKRYKNISYRENLKRTANQLVKVRVEPPK